MKIYVADNNSEALKQLEELLPRMDGVKSVTLFTYDGTNLDFLRQYRPDVVIMDNLENRVLDLSVLNAVSDYIPESLKIIYTDLSNKQYLPLCMEFGADHFVYKNSGTEFLRFILTDYIRSAEIEKEERIRPIIENPNGSMESS